MHRSTDSRRLAVALTFIACIVLSASSALASPPARIGAGMAFDPTTERMVMFGGLSEADVAQKRYSFDDTWEWTGRRWVQRATATSPAARAGVVMDTDFNRDRILLFGGGTNISEESLEFNDTWSYRDGVWTRIETPSAPPARRFAAGAFDNARDRLIVYGGLVGRDTVLRDTWEFDGTSWTQVGQDGPDISGVELVVNQATGETLLTGIGVTSTSTFEPRMYRWEGGTWVRLEPTTLPVCLSQTAMVWQEQTGRVLLHGGSCPTGAQNSDTFTWNGTNWEKVTTTGTPGSVFGQAMAYDPNRGETILFGGVDQFTRSTTYRFAGTRWRIELTSGFQPGPRSLMVLESATFNGETAQYLFGGLEDGFTRSDLWRFEGKRWRKVSAPNTPTDCSYPVGAFDSDRSRLVIVCENSNVYEYDGSTFKVFADQSTEPDSRRWSSMAYDPVRKQMVLFGGYTFPTYENDTWLWNGTRWTRAERKGLPDGRALSQLFWDPQSQRILMFGGIGRRSNDDAVKRYEDMWAFDGSRWTPITPATLPPGRYGAAVTWDPSRERIVMFGGKSTQEEYLNDQWEWNGSNWAQVQTTGTPEERMNSAMTWDPDREAIILYGGFRGKYFAHTLMLKDGQWTVIPEHYGRERGARLVGPGEDSFTERGTNSPEVPEVAAPRPPISRPSLDARNQ